MLYLLSGKITEFICWFVWDRLVVKPILPIVAMYDTHKDPEGINLLDWKFAPSAESVLCVFVINIDLLRSSIVIKGISPLKNDSLVVGGVLPVIMFSQKSLSGTFSWSSKL